MEIAAPTGPPRLPFSPYPRPGWRWNPRAGVGLALSKTLQGWINSKVSGGIWAPSAVVTVAPARGSQGPLGWMECSTTAGWTDEMDKPKAQRQKRTPAGTSSFIRFDNYKPRDSIRIQ
jgi:hypothetical protein